jgi:DNA-binding transcriptional ArsR family regulator
MDYAMTESEKLERIFKALAADARIRIVQLLKGRALCVGALATRLNVSQAAVSQHLRLLRDADLVVPERRGYFIHYRLNEKTIAKWKNAAERLLSVEEPKAPSACAKTCNEKESDHV